MLLYFAGAEVSSHFAILRECGVQRVAVSAANLNRVAKGPSIGQWASQGRLGGLEWVLYADSVHTPVSAITAVLAGAEVQPEAVTGPPEWYETSFLRDTDLQFLPTWDGNDPALLRQYTEDFDGVMLPDAAVDNPVHVRAARAALPRLGVLGALTGRTKGLERFDILCSSAWWAVQKHGETQVWTGDRLVRLNNEDKVLKRQRYADAMEALGVDVDAVLADDPTETLRLAVKSWLRLEQHIQAGHVVPVPVAVPAGPSEVARQHHPSSANVVPIGPGVARATPQTRHHMLPVMGLKQTTTVVKDAAGNDVTETSETLEVNPVSMRQCNTCSLSVGCPSFTPHAACSYEIPVTVRNKAELNAVLRALVEIQTQRILQGRFTEEVNGQADVLLGKEMDRLFKMVERWKVIEDNRDSLRVTVDSKGQAAAASMGVLSRLFGEKAGQNALRLEHPIDADEVIDQMDVGDDD